MGAKPCLAKVAAVMSAAAFLLAGCDKPAPAEAETVKDKMSFLQNECVVFVGEEVAVPVSYQVFERGVYVKADYDFETNPYGVTVNSSAPDVASVTAGKIKGLKEGSATLTLSSDKISTSGQLAVTVKKNEDTPASFNQDITQALTADMIALPLGRQDGMQSFDIDKRGQFFHVFRRHDMRPQRYAQFEPGIRLARFLKRFKDFRKDTGIRLVVDFHETFFRRNPVFSSAVRLSGSIRPNGKHSFCHTAGGIHFCS